MAREAKNQKEQKSADKGGKEKSDSKSNEQTDGTKVSRRGFASMDQNRQREIASMGGKAAHESGRAHQFDSEEARKAGRKGGEAISKNREHMAEIGRKGGESRNKENKE